MEVCGSNLSRTRSCLSRLCNISLQLNSVIKVTTSISRNRGSSVSIASRQQAGRPSFKFRKGQGLFLFAVSRPDLGPTQPSNLWVPDLSTGVKRPARGADHSPPSRAEVKNAWSYTSTRPIRLHDHHHHHHLPSRYRPTACSGSEVQLLNL
jgi:hypothetical protein